MSELLAKQATGHGSTICDTEPILSELRGATDLDATQDGGRGGFIEATYALETVQVSEVGKVVREEASSSWSGLAEGGVIADRISDEASGVAEGCRISDEATEAAGDRIVLKCND